MLILIVSEKNIDNINGVLKNYTDELSKIQNEKNIHDFCQRKILNDKHLPCRLAITAQSKEELLEKISFFLEGKSHEDIYYNDANTSESALKTVFYFPGARTGLSGIEKKLIIDNMEFRKNIEYVDKQLFNLLGFSIIEKIKTHKDHDPIDLHMDIVSLAVNICIAKTWIALGVSPDSYSGISIGEFAAAHLAGALTLNEAISAALILLKTVNNDKDKSKLLVVALSEADINAILREEGLDDKIFAVIHVEPNVTSIAGDPNGIEKLTKKFDESGVLYKSYPEANRLTAHSPQMEQFRNKVEDDLKYLNAQRSHSPFYSNAKISPIDGDNLNAQYWFSQLKSPVYFYQTVVKISSDGHYFFFDSSTSAPLADRIENILYSADKPSMIISSKINDENSTTEQLYKKILLAYVNGLRCKWDVFVKAMNFEVKQNPDITLPNVNNFTLPAPKL